MGPRALDMPHILDAVLDHLDPSKMPAVDMIGPATLSTEMEHAKARNAELVRCALVDRHWRERAQAALLRVLLFDARAVAPNPRIAMIAERLEAARAHRRVERIIVPGAATVHLDAVRPIVERCDRLVVLIASMSALYLGEVPATVRILWIGVPASRDFERLARLPELEAANLGDHRGGADDSFVPSGVSSVRSLWLDFNWGLPTALVSALPSLQHVENLYIQVGQDGPAAVHELGEMMRNKTLMPRLRLLELHGEGASVTHDGRTTMRSGWSWIRD